MPVAAKLGVEASGLRAARSASRAVSCVSTTGGTSPETSPPKVATSLTSEEARNEYSGLVGMKTVSTSTRRGVHLRHLELVVEVADRAQALDDRPDAVLLAEVGEQAVEAGDGDVGEVGAGLLEHRDPLLGA